MTVQVLPGPRKNPVPRHFIPTAPSPLSPTPSPSSFSSLLLILIPQLKLRRPSGPHLPPKGRHIQQLQRPQQLIQPPRVRRIGMIHLPVPLDKNTQPRLLALGVVPQPLGLELRGGGEIVLGRADGGVQRRVEVVVEVGAEAGVPGEGPAQLLLPGVELGEGGAGDGAEGRVARGEVAQVRDVLGCMGGFRGVLVGWWWEQEGGEGSGMEWKTNR
jgi:hypothetical protein